jgi:GT2 family glycosyltransferase
VASSAELAKLLPPAVRLVRSAENIGFGRANNLGAEQAKGDILFLLNSDTIVRSDILSAAEVRFAADGRLGILAPRLDLPDGNRQAFAFGALPTLADAVLRRHRSEPLEWVSGAALFIRRELFASLQGFDPGFFMYFEDVDLGYRAKQAGWHLAVAEDLSLVHLGGASTSRQAARRKDYYYQSQERLFAKHHGRWPVLLLKILRWPYRALGAWRLLESKQ